MQRATTLKHTPFHAFHQAAGARLVDFAGYEMPVRYTGDVREHMAVRRAAGLFDVSHMGEFHVAGPGALGFLNRMITNDVSALEVGQALYSPMCRPDGRIVDDVLVYRYADSFMVVVNASNIAKDFDWFHENLSSDVVLEDRSDRIALLALQGPKSVEVLRGHVPEAALTVGHYRFTVGTLFGAEATIARTGYTGEDGFELYFDPVHADKVWEGLMRAGHAAGLEPVGLGARDTLRLEMGFMLYGNDIDESTTPLEAGLGWTVKLGKGDFIGRDALLEQKEQGVASRLVGFTLEGRRMPRHGMAIESGGRPIGRVTSGTFSPSLERPIGLGYVERTLAAHGTTLEVSASHGVRLEARVAPVPFYTQGSRLKEPRRTVT